MPLVRVEVKNVYGLGAPEVYREANKEEPKEILEGVAVAGLIGVLRHLGDLADFAAEVFRGLQEELMMTSSRSRKLMRRVKRIEATVSSLEKVVMAQRSHLHFAYVPRSDWHARIDCEENKIVHTDLPQFILESYEDCGEPPRLHMLDRFDPGGPGSCFKRYSDPSVFKNNASAGKDLEDKKGCKIRRLRSQPRNEGVSRSFSNPGDSMLLRTMSNYDATLRSDLSKRSSLDLRNGSGYINGDLIWPSYSIQAMEKRHMSDFLECDSLEANIDVQINPTRGQHGRSSWYAPWDENAAKLHTHLEAQGDDPVNFKTADRIGIRISNQDFPKSKYNDINLDEFESKKDIFMDAPNAMELEDEVDTNCTKKQDTKLEDEPAHELMAIGPLIIGGCKHNPISLSLKSSFAALCCMSCMSAKAVNDSVSPLDESLLSLQSAGESLNQIRSHTVGSHKNGVINDHTDAEYASNGDIESGKPAPETSDATPFSFWTNGGLLGLQPSKPPDCGSNTSSFKYQDGEESSSSFRKMRCKLSPVDLGIKLGSALPIAAKQLPDDMRSLSRVFDLDNRSIASKQKLIHGEDENADASKHRMLPRITNNLFGHEPQISSPSSSPPLRHMKMSFQPIDGFETSKLKLKFPRGDESCRDIFPSFQLVPEASIARLNGCSDSDDDTFYGSSPSLSDGCHSHQSESNSEQWKSNESPDPNDLCNCLTRISFIESPSTAAENGTTSHGDKIYVQSSHSKTINHSFQDNPIPPVQWHSLKPNLDYAFNLNDSLSTLSQQPKPAPFDHDNTTSDLKRKQFISQNSDGQRETNKGKNIDEKEDFLQLIRSKSFNLRPIVTTKSTAPSASPVNVHVTAILKKADSIRQAVRSDDAEDDGDWSDGGSAV